MTHFDNLKILAFTGLPGSGKSTAVDYLTAKSFPKVYFGGVVLDAMKEAGLEHTEENERRFREDLRAKEGKDFVAKRIIEQIENLANAGQHRIVADGLYTWTEYKALKRAFPGELTVVAIVAPKRQRYHRLANRPIRPLTEKEASERDWSEIEHLEKGGPIAIADYYAMNDADTETFENRLDDILEAIDFRE
ncbi:dephospho-CoA kinase [Candidatus Saccharibacteria bacterium 32-49-12]|nr:MAG: dephospho-CoA kinase [Candidatus Saccharibacteria bacterium 32-49-12]